MKYLTKISILSIFLALMANVSVNAQHCSGKKMAVVKNNTPPEMKSSLKSKQLKTEAQINRQAKTKKSQIKKTSKAEKRAIRKRARMERKQLKKEAKLKKAEIKRNEKKRRELKEKMVENQVIN